jgi:hypothetical protein
MAGFTLVLAAANVNKITLNIKLAMIVTTITKTLCVAYSKVPGPKLRFISQIK